MEFDKCNHFWRVGGVLDFPVFGYCEPASVQVVRDNLVKGIG